MTSTFFSGSWTLLAAAPLVLLLVVPLIRLDEHLKRRKALRLDRESLLEAV